MNIKALYNPYDDKLIVVRRIWSFFRFMLLTTFSVLGAPRYDLIIATSTPLTVGLPALACKFFRGIPFIFEVRDLWPEVPIQMGILRNKAGIAVIQWYEKAIYRHARHIVALSPGMYNGVISKCPRPEKISTIPNMSKIDIFWPRSKNPDLMQAFQLKPDSFTIIYFGAMGRANGMGYILDAAKLLLREEDVRFLLIGYGAEMPLLRERCEEEAITNISFHGGMPLEKLSEAVNVCDLSLVTFSNIPILATNSPNKFFDSLSAGKPILVNSPGWTKDLVEQYECGLFADPANPSALSENILYLKNNPEIRATMGLNARKLAEEKFDKSILCKQFADLVMSLGQ
jgi:glycosyltransferase involved in cell wall biosynthesis